MYYSVSPKIISYVICGYVYYILGNAVSSHLYNLLFFLIIHLLVLFLVLNTQFQTADYIFFILGILKHLVKTIQRFTE